MIKVGQRAKAEDFIITAIAGEALVAGNAVAVGNGTDTGAVLVQINTSDNVSQVCTGSTWVSQKVRFNAVRNITHIGFRHDTQQSVGYTVSIRATLTGADLATGSFTPGSSSGGADFRTIALSVPVNLSPNTDYYVIFSGGYTVFGQTTSVYADGEARVSTNSGAAWSLHGTAADWGVQLLGGVTEAGKIYKADDSLNTLFIGFAVEAAAAGASCLVTPQLVIRGLLTGLTIGSLYFLSATKGAIATTGTYLIGVAVSTTELVRVWTKN